MGGGRTGLKIIFFGTPNYVIPILEKVYKNYEVVAVVTQPPKLAGRKQIRTFSPVDNWAFKKKVQVITNLKDALPEADLGIVAAYGQIIPGKILTHFKYGILNVHPSLLPKYRGASPIQSAILNGEPETGVTVIKMDEKVDHGPIISQFKEQVLEEDTTYSLRKRLFERSAQFLIDLIPSYINGKVKPKVQDEKKAILTKIFKKEDGFINLSKETPIKAFNFIRAMQPWPVAWTYVKKDSQKLRLKILKAHLENEKLVIDEVQLEGKNPVKWKQFEEAYGPNLLS